MHITHESCQSTLMNRDKDNIMLFLQTSRNNVLESFEKMSAFSICYNQKYVVIPEGKLTYIGIKAFKSCKKLSSLNFQSCIPVISKDTFNVSTHQKASGVKKFHPEDQ